MPEIAVIGGTSLQNISSLSEKQYLHPHSFYGESSGPLLKGKISGKEVIFLNRHGSKYSFPPHKINYRANIDALAKSGVKKIIAINAVGGINEVAIPLHISIPKQIIDYTHGREQTFFEGGKSGVNFVDFSHPFDEALRKVFIESGKKIGLENLAGGFSTESCYACTQGPRLETAAEIMRLSNDGCDLVGMTMMPEAVLAREKNIAYASVCFVVNKAAGLEDKQISIAEINRVLDKGQHKIEKFLEIILEGLK